MAPFHMASSCWMINGWERKCLADARMATSRVDVLMVTDFGLLSGDKGV